MDDLIRKTLLFTAGVGLLAKDKIEEYIAQLESIGILDQNEARDLAKQMFAEKDKQKKEFMRDVDKRVDELLKSAGLVKKSDYAKLEQRVKKLTQKAEHAKKKKVSKAKKKRR